MILKSSQNPTLLEKTWKLVGFLCGESNDHTKFFLTNSQTPILNLILAQLNTPPVSSPMIVKNCLFTLSNILVEKSAYVDEAVSLGLFDSIFQIWQQVSAFEKEPNRSREELDQIMSLREEIIYCIGNCTVAIKDTFLVEGLFLLREVLERGGL